MGKVADRDGVVWFTTLPDGWVKRRIKTISPVMRGASPRPIDDPIYFDDEGQFAWVRISDVTASKGLLLETTQRLSDIGASKSVKLDKEWLFLSIAGSVGKPCITGIQACIHDGFVYFPHISKTIQRYLFWIFESRECFSGIGKFGTQLNLNTETVGNISIPFPPLATQITIADLLDRETARIDLLIEKKQRLVVVADEKRSALITAAVTGQVSSGGMRRQREVFKGGVGMTGRIMESFPQTNLFPERVIRLGLMARIISGGTPSKNNLEFWEGGALPWIGSGEVNQGFVTEPTAHITSAAVQQSSTKLFPSGSVAMALAGQGKTKATVATMGISAYGNQSLACITKYKGSSKFLFWWLTSLYREIRGLAHV